MSVACPKCNGPMRVRTSERGSFYGCMRYPKCDGLRSAGGSAPRTDASGKWRSGGAMRLKARFPGRCTGCGSSVDEGDFILFEDRHIVGCSACRPAALAPTEKPTIAGQLPPDAAADNFWAELLQHSEPPAPQFQPLPLPVEECLRVPACAFAFDKYQRAVVHHRNGEALVAAGAGSGKTTVLVERTADLVRSGVVPESIIILVYNRAASDSLKTRLAQRLGAFIATRVNIFTFHGWSYSLIREWFPKRFGQGRVVGTDEGPPAQPMAHEAMKECGVEGFEPKDLLAMSALIREALIDLDGKRAMAQVQCLPTKPPASVAQQGLAFTKAYQRVKARRGLIDFADMLWLVNRALDFGGPRAEYLRQRYRWVMVDEAQDINPARMRVAAWLGGGVFDPTNEDNDRLAPKLLSVGDLRQSIYGFTGAQPDLVRRRLALGAKLLTLPVNRRSTAAIVAAGNAVANGRDWNLGGECKPATRTVGEPVVVWNTHTPGEEAESIVLEVLARIAGDGEDVQHDFNVQRGTVEPRLAPERIRAGLTDAQGKARFCCLVRTNGQATALECAFMARGVPVRLLGAKGGVWSTGPGRELLAYLRAASGQPDDDVARISNKPNRYLKRALVEEAVRMANGDSSVFIDALHATKAPGAVRLALDLGELARAPWEERCDKALNLLLRAVHERETLAGGEPDEDTVVAYRGLADAAVQLGSVGAIDDQVQKMKTVGTKAPAVEISTFHGAKGLEWAVTFVCGVAEGTLPHAKAQDLEEERRLFYVALTRAQEVAIVSVGNAKPSPFLDVLSASLRKRATCVNCEDARCAGECEHDSTDVDPAVGGVQAPLILEE